MARASYKDWITEEGLTRIESWARDGLTNRQIAKNIGCNEDTLYTWIKKHSEISESLKRGRAPVDFEIENLLLKKARGFEYEEVENIIDISPTGEKSQRIKKTKKYYPPDTTAIIYWLKNRKPEEWRRKSASEKEKEKLEKERAKKEIEKLDLEINSTDIREIELADGLSKLKGLFTDES